MTIKRNYLPWTFGVNVFMTPIAHTNWNTNVVSTDAIHNGWRASSGAQNDDISWDVVLPKGAWEVELLTVKDADSGIITVLVDGASQGTVDTYAVAASYNNLQSVSGISIARTREYRLTLKAATKNGSSSNYYGRIQFVRWRRTE